MEEWRCGGMVIWRSGGVHGNLFLLIIHSADKVINKIRLLVVKLIVVCFVLYNNINCSKGCKQISQNNISLTTPRAANLVGNISGGEGKRERSIDRRKRKRERERVGVRESEG